MGQHFQIFGALLLLAAYLTTQLGWLRSENRFYILMNSLGSGILAVDAFLLHQWGFLLLEGGWFMISIAGFARVTMKR